MVELSTNVVPFNEMCVCGTCKDSLSLSSFGVDKSKKSGKRTTCKRCDNKRQSFEVKQNQHFKRSYKLSFNDINNILKNQMGLCGNRGCGVMIVLERTTKNKAYVDHNHMTGKVRGLLCNSCNLALGHMKENKNRILGLTEYLQRNGE